MVDPASPIPRCGDLYHLHLSVEINLSLIYLQNTLQHASGEVIPLGEFYRKTYEKTTPNSWIYATDEHFISNHPPLLQDIGPNVSMPTSRQAERLGG